MIVRQEGDRVVIVRQADHAYLSGQLAAAWGSAPWESPAPFPSVVLAARLHDTGWLAWDEDPEVRDGRPLAFHEVDRTRTAVMYAAGVDAVSAVDPYAGLLTSLHYTGFFTSHWGWKPFSTPDRFPPQQGDALRRFLEEQAGRQHALRRALNMDGSGDKMLEANYKWLQLWDRISLDVCRQSREVPWVIDYPVVPARYQGPDAVALKFAMVGPGVYTLNPYPLLVTPFRAVVPAVSLPAGHAGRDQFRKRWRTAPVESLGVVIQGG